MDLLGCLYVIGTILGHGALHVYLYNRINATGFPRRRLKQIEKLILAHFVLQPVLLLPFDSQTIWRMLFDISEFNELTLYSKLYSIFLVAVLVMLLPLWTIGRIEYWKQARYKTNTSSKRIDVRRLSNRDLFKPRWLKGLSKFPGNQIHWIDVTTKAIAVPDLPKEWESLRVGHLSDLHLLGWYDDSFFFTAINELYALRPDLMILSGDLIDSEEAITSLSKLCQSHNCPLGNFFVLGNHDKKIEQTDRIRDAMIDAGWIDVGSGCFENHCSRRGGTLQILGNERPWFDNPNRNVCERDLLREPRSMSTLRIGVAHNPDQWPWAIKTGCQLTLSGHTHGGQIRLPVIGPIIAPSWHGSRYASGIFEHPNNVMHVSRGLAGTQPLRINCMPEASLLILKKDGRR